jgi:hypothetical protein
MKFFGILIIMNLIKINLAEEILKLDQEEEFFKKNSHKNYMLKDMKTNLNSYENLIRTLKEASETKFAQMKKLVDSNLFSGGRFKINVDTLDLENLKI